ncbi:MAG: cytochrome c biogenesis protein CcsA [Methylophaga sp.]|nr:cytochrome c biogenesis protein CcsA [Methylophaga sp.]
MAIANSLAFLLYLCCTALLIRRFVQRDQPASVSLLPVGILTVLALIFHGADIFMTMRDGWVLNLFTTLSIVAWLMALAALIWGAKTPNAPPGIIIYPIVALSLILKTSLPYEEVKSLVNPALEWHILLSLAAYSLFALAAIQAIVLAVQEQQLKQRHLAGLIRKLPPLQSMETTLFQLISSGFVLLSIGLIAGAFFIDDIFTQHLAHKTLLSLIAWCVFAIILWQRWRNGLRGKSAIKWTLIGFVFLLLAYFGSRFVLEYIIK